MKCFVAPDFSGDPGAWTEALAALPLEAELHLLGTTDSTNLRMRERARQGQAGRFSVIVADAQREGRGREGRRWDSPAGQGLWISVLLPPPPGGLPGVAPLAVGVAAAEAIERFLVAVGGEVEAAVEKAVEGGAGCEVRGRPSRLGLKWPNDLLLGAAKVGGILCEGVQMGGGDALPGVALVAGIGVNLTSPSEGGTAGGAGDRAGSPFPRAGLLDAWARVPASEEGLVPAGEEGMVPAGEEGQVPAGEKGMVPAGEEGQVHEAFRLRLAQWLLEALLRHADPPPDRLEGVLRREWEARDFLLGRALVVTPGPRGIAEGVTDDGALLVREVGGPGVGDGAPPTGASGIQREGLRRGGGEPGVLHCVRAGTVRLITEEVRVS